MSRPASKSQARREAIMKKQPAPTFHEYAKLDEEYELDALRGKDLVPALGLAEEAIVYAVGADKHGEHSWRDGMPWSRCVIKLQRHLGKFLAGESRCPQDGQHHLASVKFWCNALMEFEQTHPERDDVR